MPAEPGARPFRALRIAMVVASPFPANHGTPAGIREMAQAVAALGHEVHIATYHFGDGDPPAGVRIHRIADLGLRRQVVVGPTWDKPILDLQLVWSLVRLVHRERIDVIHAHNYEGALVGFLARLLTGRPMVYNAVNTMIDELGSYGFFPRWFADNLARLLDWFVPRLADAIIPLSEELATFLVAQGIPRARIHVIPLGIDPGVFDAANRETARQSLELGEQPVVIYTGILNRLQRVDYLIRAMSIVVRARPEARLLIVANVMKREDEEICLDLAREVGIEANMRILPGRSFSEIPSYLAAADVAVVPRPECPGFPVKLLNYLAAGRPVVVFEGSAKGLQDGESAVVVADHDWEALGRGILRLLDEPELAHRLGHNGRDWVEERFAWPALAARTLDVYRRLLPPVAAEAG